MLSQTPRPARTGASAMQQNGAQEQQLRAQLELLEHHNADLSPSSAVSPPRDTRSAPSQAVAQPSNGYSDQSASTPDGPRSLAPKSAVEAYIHPDLRASAASPPVLAATADAVNSSGDVEMMPIAAPSGHSPGSTPAGPSGPPLAPGQSSQSPGDDLSGDGRKAKRELSQSKRAAQNRAAQRAFRQRKEGYIKKLEHQVREYMEMEQSFKAMQTENYALREYVLSLQSRLVEAQGELPQPPPNVDLSHPPNTSAPDEVPSNSASGNQLEVVAQAVAGLAAQEELSDRQHQQQQYANSSYKTESATEDTRTPEEINRQLHVDEARDPPAEV